MNLARGRGHPCSVTAVLPEEGGCGQVLSARMVCEGKAVEAHGYLEKACVPERVKAARLRALKRALSRTH